MRAFSANARVLSAGRYQRSQSVSTATLSPPEEPCGPIVICSVCEEPVHRCRCEDGPTECVIGEECR